jgi:hypothetical protein
MQTYSIYPSVFSDVGITEKKFIHALKKAARHWVYISVDVNQLLIPVKKVLYKDNTFSGASSCG